MAENLPGDMELKVTADASQHNAALKQAEQAANQYAQNAGDKVDQSASRMQTSMKGVGKSVGDAVQAFTKFIGIPAAIAGVAVGMYKLGQAIREGFINVIEDASAKSERFFQTLDKSGGSTEQQLAAVNKQIQDLTSQLGGSQESKVGYLNNLLFGAGSAGDIEKQLEQVGNRAEILRAKLQSERDEKDKKAAAEEEKRVQALERARDEAQSASLEGKEKIEFDSARRIADLQAQLSRETSERGRSALEQTISWEYQKRNQALADLAVKEQEDKRKLQEQEEAADEKIADARNDLMRKTLSEQEAIEFDAVRREAELRMQLDKETNAERRRLIEEMIALEAELREKAFGELMKRQFDELLRMRDAIESSNNRMTYSLGAISQQLNSIIARMTNP